MAASQFFYKHFTTLPMSKQQGAFTASSRAGFQLIADWSSDLGESSNVRVCAQMAPTLGQKTNILTLLQESHWVLQVILNAYIYNFLTHLCSDWLSSWRMCAFNLPGKAPKVKFPLEVQKHELSQLNSGCFCGLVAELLFPVLSLCVDREHSSLTPVFLLYCFSSFEGLTR